MSEPDAKRRRETDEFLVRFGNFFFQAEVAHLVLLHASGTKAGFKVNGRKHFTPFDFVRPNPPSEGDGK